jgi:hypothetical protein
MSSTNSKRKPFGLELATQLLKDGWLAFWGDYPNRIAVYCKICGKRIEAGQSTNFYYWYGEKKAKENPMWGKMHRGYDFLYSSHFACTECETTLFAEVIIS